MNMESLWKSAHGGTIEVREEKPVSVPLRPPQISNGLVWDLT